MNISNIFNIVYSYLLSWLYTMNSKTKTKIMTMKKVHRARLLNFRNSSSPYSECETKGIKRKNFIITDDKRKSRLGKVSFPHSHEFPLVEEIHFCSFIREWVLDE